MTQQTEFKNMRSTLHYVLAKIGDGYTVIRYFDLKGLQTVTGEWAKGWANKLLTSTPYEFDKAMDYEFKTYDEPLTDYSQYFKSKTTQP